jgi:hypothetical protein
LVQHECGGRYEMGPPSDPFNSWFGSGEVVSEEVDCGGRCRDGACPKVCPELGETLECVSVDVAGNAVFTQRAGGWSYACKFYGSKWTPECDVFQAGDAVEILDTGGSGCVALASFVGRNERGNQCFYHSCVVSPR